MPEEGKFLICTFKGTKCRASRRHLFELRPHVLILNQLAEITAIADSSLRIEYIIRSTSEKTGRVAEISILNN